MKMMQSVFVVKESAPVVEAIFGLHFPDVEEVLDPTCGHGRFWKWRYPFRLVMGDKDPTRAINLVCDATHLPLNPKSVDVVVLDPPFYPSRSKGNEGKRGVEYGTASDSSAGWIDDVLQMYYKMIDEAFRVGKVGVIIKCKDMIFSGKPEWVRTYLINYVKQKYGIYPEDIALQVFNGTLISDPRWKVQRHFRRQESYWLIYKLQ